MRHGYRGTTDTTAALKSYLATARSFYLVDLHDVILAGLGYPNKLALRWCDQPFDVPFYVPQPEGGAAATYAGGTHTTASGAAEPAPKLQRGQRRDVIGVEVDTLDVDIYLDGAELVPAADGGGSTPRFGLAEGILAGLFDGAAYTLRRLYLPSPPTAPYAASIANRGDLGPGDTSLGAVTLFGGFITEAKVSQSRASLTVKSALEKLSVGMPWRLYQANCPFQLYDALCGVSRTGSFGGNNFQETPRVSSLAGTDLRTILVTSSYPTNTALTQPQNYWRFGTVQFTSGVLAGLTRSVQSSGTFPPGSTTYLQLLTPLPRVPAAGDTVIVQAGCNKVERTIGSVSGDCENKFGNFVDSDTSGSYTVNGQTYTNIHKNGLRFGGFSRVPPPDSAI